MVVDQFLDEIELEIRSKMDIIIKELRSENKYFWSRIFYKGSKNPYEYCEYGLNYSNLLYLRAKKAAYEAIKYNYYANGKRIISLEKILALTEIDLNEATDYVSFLKEHFECKECYMCRKDREALEIKENFSGDTFDYQMILAEGLVNEDSIN